MTPKDRVGKEARIRRRVIARLDKPDPRARFLAAWGRGFVTGKKGAAVRKGPASVADVDAFLERMAVRFGGDDLAGPQRLAFACQSLYRAAALVGADTLAKWCEALLSREEGDLIGRVRPAVLVAVGSGVVNDIARYASFLAELPYISVATAPSMDGYASSIAALQFEGVKVTKPAHAPEAIFAALDVLAAAPWPLIQSGFGDLACKATSLLDWKLASRLYGEHWCGACHDMVREPLVHAVGRARDLRARDPEALRGLFIGLINSGVAMALIGHSRPASGSEHHCSHYWDYLAYTGEREHAPHGLQVGYAAHFTMALYRQLPTLDTLRTPAVPQLDGKWEADVRRRWGDGADDIVREQRAKRAWMLERRDRSAWDAAALAELQSALRADLARLPAADRALEEIGIPGTFGYLGVTEPMLRRTFAHANEIRARYTVFDFYEGQGVRAQMAERALDEAASKTRRR